MATRKVQRFVDSFLRSYLFCDSIDLSIIEEFEPSEHASVFVLLDEHSSLSIHRRCWVRLYFSHLKLDIPNYELDSLYFRLKETSFWRSRFNKIRDQAFGFEAFKNGSVLSTGHYVDIWTLEKWRKKQEIQADWREKMPVRSSSGRSCSLAVARDASVSNPVNQRNEMLFKLDGVEDWANYLGYTCLFITATCPSRFHPHKIVRDKRGNIIKFYQNKAYDGKSTPSDSNRHLMKRFASFRRWCSDSDIDWLGYGAVEPHESGVAHHHKLIWVPDDRVNDVVRIMSKHYLKESPHEKGAAPHPRFNHFGELKEGCVAESGDEDLDMAARAGARFQVVKIDPEKGSAVGYVVKYVSKNIGLSIEKGKHNERDENGERVKAWASLWNIDQFSWFGDLPPAYFLREMRRLDRSMPEYDSDGIIDALHHSLERKGKKYFDFIKLLGGSGRDQIKALKEDYENIYGEKASRLAGLEFINPNDCGINVFIRTRMESWTIERPVHDDKSFDYAQYAVDNQRKTQNTSTFEWVWGGTGKEEVGYVIDSLSKKEFADYQNNLISSISIYTQINSIFIDNEYDDNTKPGSEREASAARADLGFAWSPVINRTILSENEKLKQLSEERLNQKVDIKDVNYFKNIVHIPTSSSKTSKNVITAADREKTIAKIKAIMGDDYDDSDDFQVSVDSKISKISKSSKSYGINLVNYESKQAFWSKLFETANCNK